MADTIQDLEYGKFRTTSSGKAVAVVSTGDPSGLLAGLSYDDIQVTYNALTDVFVYFLSGVEQASIEVTYSDSTKQVTTRARRI